MVIIDTLKARVIDTDHVEVTWSIASSAEPIGRYTFTLLRSEAEHGPYEPVAGPFKDHYRVLDTPPTTRRPYGWFYRLRVSDGTNTEQFPADGGITPLAQPERVGLELARIEHLRLSRGDGRIVTLLPRRHFGQRCSCLDSITGRVLDSSCTTCYRTGYVGGFHSAVQVHAQILNIRPSGKDGVGTTALLRMGNTPALARDDVVVESENARWLVTQAVPVELHRALVRQEGYLVELQRDDIVWQHPVAFHVDDPLDDRLYRRRMSV